MGERTYAAVDLGASSGRVLLGRVEDGVIKLEEVHRFDNLQHRACGHDCWDVEGLFDEIVTGLAKCKSDFGAEPVSVGIDTWGVDFVLLDGADCMLGDSVAYRDARTQGMYAVSDAMVDPETVYRATGIQRQPFNTLYQLIALSREHPEQLEAARTFLMIPDYLNWRLCGVKANEYTNATTTGMLNARTLQWDPEILASCGIPSGIFQPVTIPGAVLGRLTPEVSERVGYECEVVLPATHDTGSAFLAVPVRDKNSVIISSGTWSLLGVEHEGPVTSDASRLQNFTNEGGFQKRFRFLKNIMGLWMMQSVRRELNGVDYVAGKTSHKAQSDHQYSFPELIGLAREASDFEAYVNVDDDRFLAPDSMIDEVVATCRETGQPVPSTVGEIMRTVYCSLSRRYAEAVDDLRALTGRDYDATNIVGGGCQDMYLNELTSKACGLPVFAGPVEGTGLGNLVVQFIHSGEFADVTEARAAIAKSFDVKRVDPSE